MALPLRTLTAVAGVSLTGVGGYYYMKSNKSPAITTTTTTTTTSGKGSLSEQQLKHHDSRPFTLLTNSDIDERLRSGQFSNKIQNVPHVKATYTNRLPSNNPVEDNFSIHTFQNGLIAGVYDGHIGPQCSRLIKDQLPIYVARELSLHEQQTLDEEKTEEAISTAFVDLDKDIQQRFYDIFPKNLKHATEKDIRAAIARQPDQKATQATIDEAINGSCACAVYIKDGIVYSANTGDSRVVIVSQDEDGTWKGRRLVEEESPANPEWHKHMISQHPDDESKELVMRNRVFGLIAVGGSFGDIMYKVPVEYQMKVLPFIPYDTYKTFARYHHRITVRYKTPPYLQSKPLTSHHKLTPQDRFVVLGTDGLWDELSWDDVRSTDGDQVAANIMSGWRKSNNDSQQHKAESNAATHLVRQALLYEAVWKNVRVDEPVEDETLELSKRLTRKPSRSYRDDITITVIELGSTQEPPVVENVGPVYETEEMNVDGVPRLANPKKGGSWFSGWIWSRL